MGALQDWCKRQLIQQLEAQAVLHALEGISERLAFDAYGIECADRTAIVAETGSPAAWYPLVVGFDSIPNIAFTNEKIRELLHHDLEAHKHCELSQSELRSLIEDLHQRFESANEGTNAAVPDRISEDENSDEDNINHNCIPYPNETLLENLAQELKIHPISAYWLLSEGINQRDWRRASHERREVSRLLSVIILQLFGHRWPAQVEQDENLLETVDDDGISPITECVSEPTVLTKVRQRLGTLFCEYEEVEIERELGQILGKSLDRWVATEFFKHHSKDFKKRPIIWQLQSAKFTTRRTPVFSCLVYYGRLDSDTLPKIRTQYLSPIKTQYETELRGIESLNSTARSELQERRRLELTERIEELKQFDAQLEGLNTSAFSSKQLELIVSNEPVDKWGSPDGRRQPPATIEAFIRQEAAYLPNRNDGVRVNIAPLQKMGLLAAHVLSKKDVEAAIAARAEWRADERRWAREGKLQTPGWWLEAVDGNLANSPIHESVGSRGSD